MAIHRLKASEPYLSVRLASNESEVQAIALVDTGASMTAVHPQIIDQIQPIKIGVELIRRVNAEPVRVPTYYLTIRLAPESKVFGVEVVASIPASPCEILIGRDLLSRWVLAWDGELDQLLISY